MTDPARPDLPWSRPPYAVSSGHRMSKAHAMSCDRPSSSLHRASRAWLLSIALSAFAAMPGTGPHTIRQPTRSPLRAGSKEMTGRLEAITVIGRPSHSSVSVAGVADGQRFQLENAGATATGALVTVSGKLTRHTIVADIVRGAIPQAATLTPRSAHAASSPARSACSTRLS